MITFSVKTTPLDPNMLKRPCTLAVSALANQAHKDTTPFVPAMTGAFSQLSRVVGNYIIYDGVQARYLWNGKVMVDSLTGRGAFYIEDVGFRFRRGASLVATDRNLVFTTSVHPQAQSHWFDASKKQNMEKWTRVFEKAVKNYL